MLDLRRSGDAIAATALDLARVWRGARAATRRDWFPGVLDGAIEGFFALAGAYLAEGRDAEEVWPATAGVVRVDAHDKRRSRAELDAEWDLAEQVLQAACQALSAGDEVTDWMARAIALARGGRRKLLAGEGPAGIVVVRTFSGATPPARGRAGR
jgi:hypothetical protein